MRYYGHRGRGVKEALGGFTGRRSRAQVGERLGICTVHAKRTRSSQGSTDFGGEAGPGSRLTLCMVVMCVTVVCCLEIGTHPGDHQSIP